jgi:hypothetical protein
MKLARLKEAGTTLEIRGGRRINSAETLTEDEFQKLMAVKPELEPLFEVFEEVPVKTSSKKGE